MARTLDRMDLAELIERTKGDRSYEQLADASGGSPSRQRWQQLGRQTSSAGMPDPGTIKTIASVLGVAERVALLAAARTAGLVVDEEGTPLGTLLPPSARQLTDRQVAAILSVVRAMLEPTDGTPMTPEEHEQATNLRLIQQQLGADRLKGEDRRTQDRRDG